MKNFRVLIFLGFCLAVLGFAWVMARNDLRVYGGDSRQPGNIRAVLMERPKGASLISSLHHRIVLTLADGKTVPIELMQLEPTGESAATTDPRYLDAARRIARSDANEIRRLLQRESRDTKNAARIQKIEKTEVAKGWDPVDAKDVRYAVDSAGLIRPSGIADDIQPNLEIETSASFVAPGWTGQSGAQKNSKELFQKFERIVNGKPVEPARKDFVLHAEPYSTIQWPVFSFEASTGTRAQKADIGKRGPPSNAYPLFTACRAAIDPSQPDQALIIADAGSRADNPDLLKWFGRYCEGIFTRWAYPTMLTALSICLIAMGIIVMIPSRIGGVGHSVGSSGHVESQEKPQEDR